MYTKMPRKMGMKVKVSRIGAEITFAKFLLTSWFCFQVWQNLGHMVEEDLADIESIKVKGHMAGEGWVFGDIEITSSWQSQVHWTQ